MSAVYGVGVIGTAWAAKSPLPTFTTYERTKLIAVTSGRLERAKATAEQFGAAHAFDDYRQMLELPDIAIVYVGAPVYLHAEMVEAAAAAGKHILCEKPLAVDVAQGRAMLNAVRQYQRAHIVAFTMRHYPSSLYVRQLIDEGFLGEIRHVSAVQFFGMPAGLPPRPWTWLNDESLGGGYLGALGSHLIDLTRSFGVEFREVVGQTRVWNTATLGDNGQIRAATADDSFALLATLTNGGLFTLHFSAANRAGTGSRLELYGSNGTIVIENSEKVSVAGPQDRALQVVETPPATFPENVAASAVPRFGYMIHKLIDGIENGAVHTPNIEDGLRCQEVMDAVRLSQREGRIVRIEEFATP